jgi:hypothetical protein
MKEPPMEQITRIGMDTSKSVFQVHGVDAAETPVLRRKLTRKEMTRFFEKLPPTLVAIEACASSHHWARLLTSLGHDVRLIAPQLVKPYVKRGKNDAADAEALCEAAGRPTMRFLDDQLLKSTQAPRFLSKGRGGFYAPRVCVQPTGTADRLAGGKGAGSERTRTLQDNINILSIAKMARGTQDHVRVAF